jgi:hypothetical protein
MKNFDDKLKENTVKKGHKIPGNPIIKIDNSGGLCCNQLCGLLPCG